MRISVRGTWGVAAIWSSSFGVSIVFALRKGGGYVWIWLEGFEFISTARQLSAWLIIPNCMLWEAYQQLLIHTWYRQPICCIRWSNSYIAQHWSVDLHCICLEVGNFLSSCLLLVWTSFDSMTVLKNYEHFLLLLFGRFLCAFFVCMYVCMHMHVCIGREEDWGVGLDLFCHFLDCPSNSLFTLQLIASSIILISSVHFRWHALVVTHMTSFCVHLSVRSSYHW